MTNKMEEMPDLEQLARELEQIKFRTQALELKVADALAVARRAAEAEAEAVARIQRRQALKT